MSVLEVSETMHGPVAVVTATGELDLREAPGFSERLRGACDRTAGPVTVDFTRLEFIDSSGLATLLNVARRLTRARRPFNVVAPPGAAPRRIFELSRLEETVRVQDTLEAALADHASRAGEAVSRGH